MDFIFSYKEKLWWFEILELTKKTILSAMLFILMNLLRVMIAI